MAKKEKLYRVSSNEHFNLMSMHDKVMCQVYDARESGTFDEIFAAETAKNELEDLIDKAPYVGALVTWKTLARIREIAAAREMMRDQICAVARSDDQICAVARSDDQICAVARSDDQICAVARSDNQICAAARSI